MSIAYVIKGVDYESSEILAIFVDDEEGANQYYEENRYRNFDHGVILRKYEVGPQPCDRGFKATVGGATEYSEKSYEHALRKAEIAEKKRLAMYRPTWSVRADVATKELWDRRFKEKVYMPDDYRIDHNRGSNFHTVLSAVSAEHAEELARALIQ